MNRTALAVAACVAVLGAGCSQESPTALDKTPAASPTAAPQPTAPSQSSGDTMPFDPGFGAPQSRDGCPDPEPATGWLTATGDGLSLERFRTLHSDAEGEAYAETHGLEFPFANDYHDAADGSTRSLVLGEGTVCTGAILVGYREPLADHVVSCTALRRAAARGSVPVAVWESGDEVVQVSELYRP